MREFLIAVLACGASLPAAGQNRLHPVPEVDRNMKTGPAVGSTIPAFEVTDQNGKQQTFESLRGPKGLYLMFVRSADW